jgi:hypothetical protein
MRAQRERFVSLDLATKQKMLDMYAAGEKLIVIQALREEYKVDDA